MSRLIMTNTNLTGLSLKSWLASKKKSEQIAEVSPQHSTWHYTPATPPLPPSGFPGHSSQAGSRAVVGQPGGWLQSLSESLAGWGVSAYAGWLAAGWLGTDLLAGWRFLRLLPLSQSRCSSCTCGTLAGSLPLIAIQRLDLTSCNTPRTPLT